MNKRILLFLGLFSLALTAGCDMQTTENPRHVRPDLKIRFVEPRALDGLTKTQGTIGAPDFTQGVWTIQLSVTSKGGQNYSPKENNPRVVDDTVQSETTFDLQVPLDSTYTFQVLYSQNGVIRARGVTVQQITKNNPVVYMDVVYLPKDNNTPTIGFNPGIVSVQANGSYKDVALRIEGITEPVKAVAAKLNISGVDLSRLRFRNAIVIRQPYGADLAWTFPQGIRPPFVMDTISIPTDVAGADIRLAFQQGELRILTDPNQIRSFSVTDLRVLVK